MRGTRFRVPRDVAPRRLDGILVGHSHDPITLCAQESGASEVAAQFHIGRMSCTVDLDDEPLLSTRKVGKARAARFLTDEFESAQGRVLAGGRHQL
jgi:hypothetical protein